MILLNASSGGQILECQRRAQWLLRRGAAKDPVRTAAAIVGEWAHAAWLTPDWDQVAAMNKLAHQPVKWDEVTRDHRDALRQAWAIAPVAEDLLDAVAPETARREQETEKPLTCDVGPVRVKCRADVFWREDGRDCIAELKTGRRRAGDLMQLSLTAAPVIEAAGDRAVWGYLLYVPRAGGQVEALAYPGGELETMAHALARDWNDGVLPVPSYHCDTCPVSACAAGRPDRTSIGEIRP